jgi:predicted alpha/beta hydrolase
MNGWLRLETEQRGSWLRQRVQDLRAAQVARQSESAAALPTPIAARRQPTEDLGCPEAA